MERENFKSRLGFILISAGCAIGIGRGSLFFLFMTFASFSTIIAVFENIIACCMDKWNISRKKASLINCIIILVASLLCVLDYNVWSSFQPRGAGSTVLDLEDFIVSNLLLPVGSLIFLLFCVTRWGWALIGIWKKLIPERDQRFQRHCVDMLLM